MASGTDQLAALRAGVQAEQDRQTAEAIRLSNPNAEPQANAFPSNTNDDALAASLNELRSKDAEYAKLNSDAAREQWEQITRRNLLQKQQSEQVRADTQAATIANRDAADEKDLRYLATVAVELLPMVNQYKSEYSMPPDLLKAWSNNIQQLDNLAARMGIAREELTNRAVQLLAGQGVQPQPDLGSQMPEQNSHPETFPDGSLYQMTNNPDGTVEVKMITGERFVGDPLKVTRQIAESSAYTRRKVRELSQQVKRQPEPSNGNGDGSEVAENSFGAWAANESARALGFSDHNEMVQWGQQIQQTQQEQAAKLEEYENMRDAADFMQRCQDFPNTDQAIEALGTIIENQNLDWTPDGMETAHALAVRNGFYKPLTQAEISESWASALGIENQRVANRAGGSPPPMLRGSAPDSHGDPDANNPWKMGLADLRKAAIAQELGGQSR